MSRATVSRTALFHRADPLGFRLGWFLGLAAWLFVMASLLSHSPADPPGHAAAPLNDPVSNWCGPVGAFVSHQAFLMLGSGAWVVAGSWALWLGLTAAGRTVSQVGVRAVGVALAAISVAGFHALLLPSLSAAPEGAGGLLAINGVGFLVQRFGTLGAGLWLALVGIVGATVAYDIWVIAAPRWLFGAASGVAAAVMRRLGALRASRAAVREDDLDESPARARNRSLRSATPTKKRRRRAEPEDEEEEDEDAVAEDEHEEDLEDEIDEELEDEYDDSEDEEEEEEEEDDEEAPGAPQVFDPEELRAKMSKLPVRFAAASRRSATAEDLADLRAQDTEATEYRFPGLDLLEDPEENYSGKLEEYVRDQAQRLEEALRVYRIEGEVVGIDSGPVITMYEIALAPGTKVSQLNAISSDLARAMKVVSVRIVPNIEGRDTVGVEAPNIEKEKVRLKELMSVSDKASKMRLPLFLGKDASGEPLIYDLASMPHMLIAGTTGSGKSVAINAIIMGFLYTKKPSELRLVLVDPKMVEMSQFRDVPHLMCPVVTEMSKAAAILEWAVRKMDERYELLAEAGCRDIDSYNELTWEELKERLSPQSEAEEAAIPRRLPRIVFMIDELADLMMTHKEVESSIVRIAQKARAVGIHLILATQRPQANVVTGLIKSNMPARMCFKVASGMDSRIVMDQKGGEVLLGQGDMLFLSPRSSKVVRAQGTLVEDRETRRAVRFLKEVASPSFERSLVQLRGPGSSEPVNGVDLAPGDGVGRDWNRVAQEDPLFEKAVEIVIESGRGSVSLLQRRLAIGYTRASRLIELMGIAAIIGEHKGSVAREVMISPEEWAAMKEQAARDAAESNGTLFAPGDRKAPRYPDDPEDDAPAPARTGDEEDGDSAPTAGRDQDEDDYEEDEDKESDDDEVEEDEEEEDEDFDADEDEEEDEEDGEEEEEEEGSEDEEESEDEDEEWDEEESDDEEEEEDDEEYDEDEEEEEEEEEDEELEDSAESGEDAEDEADDAEDEADDGEEEADEEPPTVEIPPFRPTRSRG